MVMEEYYPPIMYVVSIAILKNIHRGSCCYSYFIDKEADISNETIYWVIQWNCSQAIPEVHISKFLHPQSTLDTIKRQICWKT